MALKTVDLGGQRNHGEHKQSNAKLFVFCFVRKMFPIVFFYLLCATIVHLDTIVGKKAEKLFIMCSIVLKMIYDSLNKKKLNVYLRSFC